MGVRIFICFTSTVIDFESRIIVTLDKEITLYRTHGTNKTLLLLSFSRYYTLLCLILDVTFNLVNNPTPEFCHRIRWVLPFLSTTIQFAAIPLLLLRTWAIWRRNAIITALLLALWILPLIIGTYVSTTYEGVPYALFLGLDVVGGCGNDPTNNWGTVPFILNLVVDSLIFLLTLSHLLFFQKHAIGITSLRRVIIRDGMVYYAAMVVVNVINIVFFLAPGLPPLARPLIATPATIMPAILVGRLYFNLTGNFLPGGESAGSREGTARRCWSPSLRIRLGRVRGRQGRFRNEAICTR
ncbi:hypothetical protein BDP27DRAFT_307021 [Rhodocollybia butyracea]|uniref:Uncharacterized protein n=1 Tax=Rhodocollybia butyracea TaxID=206335 RepID=A0A9P5TZZ4_9AGAR|nr:hypothetical protein BDP27DRAFT_307021 [Rhodocollybia butyracea]